MTQYLGSLGPFLQWFTLGLGLLVVFITIYLWTTPHPELQLIREGNVSAAVCLAGTIIGYALPLASAMVHGGNIADFAIWGVIGMVVQMGIYFLVCAAFKDFTRHIIEDRISVAIFAASLSLAGGILNAAAQSG